jgi:succinoglycan biosynthesis transport protein ExoP
MPEGDELIRRERKSSDELLRRVNYPVLDVEPEDSDAYAYLRVYWRILAKRRWTIFTVVFVLTTLAAIYAFKTKPVYQATARVEVEAEEPSFQTATEPYRSIPTDDTYLQTQVDVLKSDNLAWQTIEQLRLDLNPEFNPAAGHRNTQQEESASAVETRLIRTFHGDLQVTLARGSRMLKVSFESTDPRLAAQVATALVNNYIQYNFSTQYDATRQASGWMGRQLDDLKAKVEKSQQALVDYERQNAIVNISDKENVVEQRLADLSQDLTTAENDLAQKESVYDLVKANPSQVASLAQDELLQRLQEKYADAKTEYVNALAQYGPRFPKVVQLQDQVNELHGLIEQERERTVERIDRDYQAALNRETILEAAVAREKVKVGNLNQLLIQHDLLKHDFETNQELYDSLLKRLKNATVSAGLRATNIHIVDNALVPGVPVRPKKALDIAIGLMVGLILGITLAFVEEGLDNSVKNAEDVERLVPAPILAVIPAAGSVGPRSSWLGLGNGKHAASNGSVAMVVAKQPNSMLAESYRSLRTAIKLSMAPRPPQTLLVTSTQPGEGKTSTSVNLAIALAQQGCRVLLVDADLRKPSIAHSLGLSEKPGLSGYLTGAHGLDEALQQVESLANLSVLPAGPHPPNPAELLASPTMEKLIAELRLRFEHVIIDSPPVLTVTDATVLSKWVDGVVVVIESNVTPKHAVVRTYKVLETAGARMLGAVLNKMDFRHDGYYGYAYKAYYHSYYHDEPSKTGESKPAGPASPALRQ